MFSHLQGERAAEREEEEEAGAVPGTEGLCAYHNQKDIQMLQYVLQGVL